jgi:hypothetical protein
MSSHREAPSISSGTAFSAVSALAALEMPTSLFEEHSHNESSAEDDLHVNLNITDLYAFQKPNDVHKSILIMNVNPMPPKLADAFDPQAIYEFRIDSNGDAVADIAFRITFSPFTNGEQTAIVRRASGKAAAGKGNDGEVLVMNAPVSFDRRVQVTEVGGYRFFAGARSDPFFFDLMGFCNTFKFTGNDYFLDKDVFGIVLEVPNTALGEQPAIGLWCRVMFPHNSELLQVARLGFPMLNILFNAGEDKHLFNQTEPGQHRELFLSKFVAILVKLGRSNEQAQQIAQRFLPDILRYDSSSTTGFFNGRKLTDDVTDILLNMVTGGKVTTDMVGPHSDYLTEFPYLGQPHER